MKYIFFVNEHNFFRLLCLGIMRKHVYVYKTEAFFKFLEPLLRWAVNLIIKFRLIRNIRDIEPKTIWFDNLPQEVLFNDVYPKSVAQIEKHFNVEGKFSNNPQYIYPALNVLDFYADWLVASVNLTEWLNSVLPAGSWCIIGLKSEHMIIQKMAYGTVPDFRYSLAPRLDLIANCFNFIAILVYSLGWLGTRIRWAVKKETYFFAADSWATYDSELFDKIIDNPEEILIFQRDKAHARRDREKYVKNRKCFKSDGHLNLQRLISVAFVMLRDMRIIWSDWKHHDPLLFHSMIKLPIKRAMYTAFFDRFSIRYFWGRDDYAVDHILRNQELRKIGGTSLGVNHGLPLKCYHPSWRHVDFDYYYTFGRHLYENYYKKIWSRELVIRPVGSLRYKQTRLSAERNNDIVFFISAGFDSRFNIETILKVAEHFSGRKILVKFKPGHRVNGSCADELEMLKSTLPNIEESQLSTYELMGRAKYAISTGSTVAAEALQHGIPTFVLDGEMNGEYFYYRDFPKLCVLNGEEIINRIEDIESGCEIYDVEDYAELIVVSDCKAHNIIRKDMGLPPLEMEVSTQ